MYHDHTYRFITVYDSDPIDLKVEKFRKGIEEHPEYKDEFLRNLANTYFMEGMRDKAIETIQQAIDCAPRDKDKLGDYYYFLSLFYEGNDDMPSSLQAMKNAVEADPENSQFRMNVANDYLYMKEYEQAVIHYTEVFFHPDDDFTEYKEHPFYTYFNVDKEDELNKSKAVTVLNKLMKAAATDEQRTCVHCAISLMYEQREDNIHALESAKAAYTMMPGNIHVINHLGDLYSTLRQYKEAIKVFENLPGISDPYLSKSFIMHWYYDKLALAHLGLNLFDEAAALYEKDLTTYDTPTDAHDCLHQLAGIYQHQRQYKKLKPVAMKIIELWPNQYSKAYGSMANYYMVEEEDYENALNYLFKAAQVNCQSDDWVHGNDRVQAAAIYGSIGDIYYLELKDEASAISYYEKVFLCQPDKDTEEHICTRLYEIYKKNGNEKRAAELKEKRKSLAKLMDMFTEPFVMPPPPNLKERLSKPKNTAEEIEKLPYYYKNLPEGTMNLDVRVKLRDEFYEDLMTNPVYKEYFSKFQEYSIREFCWEYAKQKTDLINSAKLYSDPFVDRKEYWLNWYTENIFKLILQKKLFNMQLLWRAEKIDIPEIDIAFDFHLWENNILICPFLEAVTAGELKVMKDFLMNDNFSDELGFLGGWQDYDILMQKSEEDDLEYMPPWYEYYDEKMGTGALLSLPDIRGEKEEEYQQVYRKWKQKQPPDPVVPAEPQPPYKDHMFYDDKYVVPFMEEFENDYICKLKQASIDHEARPAKPYDLDALREAVWDIDESETEVYFDNTIPWHEALLKAAQKVKNSHVSEQLDAVWEFHCMQIEMNLMPSIDITKNISYSTRRIYWESISKGKELSGE